MTSFNDRLMWKCKINEPVPSQLAFLSWCFIIAILTLSTVEMGLKIKGYCCNRTDHINLGKIMEELWNFGLEKSLSVQSSVDYSIGVSTGRLLSAVQMIEVWVVK